MVIDTKGVKRLLVTGSRTWPCARALVTVLKDCYQPGIVLVVGDAKGVDTSVTRIWRKQGGEVAVYEADWQLFNRRAGIIRNEAMCRSLDPERDLALAFIHNHSRGATHCLAYAQEWNIPTLVWRISTPSGIAHERAETRYREYEISGL